MNEQVMKIDQVEIGCAVTKKSNEQERDKRDRAMVFARDVLPQSTQRRGVCRR